MQLPEVRYARSGDVAIAYLTAGDGPIDLLFTSGYVYSGESLWGHPKPRHLVERLASFSRLIIFDRRGTGLSDPTSPADPPTFEQWNDDAIAVLDAVRSEQAAIFGWANIGGPAAMVFAASHPDRTRALILANTYPRALSAHDYPWGLDPAQAQVRLAGLGRRWGSREQIRQSPSPPQGIDEDELDWMVRSYQRGASPATASMISRIAMQTDVRGILPTIGVPTLVIHRATMSLSGSIPVERSRDLADRIPGATFVDLGEGEIYPWRGDSDAIVDEVQQFLTGAKPEVPLDRVLATVLFTDMGSSTPQTAALGDRAWRELLDRYDEISRKHVETHRGRWVKNTGDGTLATFDGPARAVRCAIDIRASTAELGLDLRAGLHAGEVELRGDDVTGIAVVIARRVCDLAGVRDVLVSRTVNDLVAGSGLGFADRGDHELKGVPGTWQLFAVD